MMPVVSITAETSESMPDSPARPVKRDCHQGEAVILERKTREHSWG